MAAENSCSAWRRSPVCRNAQPCAALVAATLFANAGGTSGRVNSGYRGEVTTGGGTTFGAHALASMTATSRSFRMTNYLLRRWAEAAEQPARHIGGDRDTAVARLVQQHAAVAVDPGDAL